MSTPGDEEGSGRPATLADRVAWSPPSAGGFAYVPGHVLVRGQAAADHLDAITGADHKRRRLGRREAGPEVSWILVLDVADALTVIALLRADGFEAQPDHAFFAHGCGGCCCGRHPCETFDAPAGDAYGANPYRANPYRANPYRANPYRANPYRANPYRANETQTSSAVPAIGPSFPVRTLAVTGPGPRVLVLDTGLAEAPQLPALLSDASRIGGDADLPDTALTVDGTVLPGDGWLDPVAGHGTFIAGLIEQLTPGCSVRVEHVISPLGDAPESDVVIAVQNAAALPDGDRPDLLSLSFGGTAPEPPQALASAIALAQLSGIVVVASAGNDASCEPQYPAALDGVVAVGALSPDGPAPWTNYGEWVDACAPGSDLVSAFFADFDGPLPEVNAVDLDRFASWAVWSGTSFAAPVVVAALAREMVLGATSAQDAVERVVRAPAALRIRNLGTVVTA